MSKQSGGPKKSAEGQAGWEYMSDVVDQGAKGNPRSRMASSENRQIRKINPLGMRVLVRIRDEGNQTEAGLYLPEGAREKMQESLLAEVLEVASAIDDDTKEEANVSGIPHGSLVLIPQKAGTRVPWDDSLRIVDTKEVLALVHEVSIV